MSKTAEIKKVFESATLTGKLVQLNTELANEFIDSIKDQSALIKKARLVRMSKPNKTIAKLYANGRFLKLGTSGSALQDADAQTMSTATIELSSKLVKGLVIATDEELADNIEGLAYEDHMIAIITKKIANELEEIGMYSRKSALPLDTLSAFDGFKRSFELTGNVVDANVGFADRYVAKDKFAKGLKSIPTRFRDGLVYAMGSDAVIDYKLLFDTVADSVVRGDLTTGILGKPMLEVPLMRNDEPVVVSAGGANTTLTADALAGQKVVAVTATTNMSVGDQLCIDLGGAEQQTCTIASISSLNVTMVENLRIKALSGATIKEVTRDGTDALLTNPMNLIYAIQNTDISFEIERIAGVGYKYHWKMRIDFAVEETTAGCLIKNMKIK